MKVLKSNERKQEVPIDVVLPFYVYAALLYLVSCLLLFFSTDDLNGHHFQPSILAITHSMALGWGTMMILGASYQLVPVLIESRLQSILIAKASFMLAALGIPFLLYGFYTFQLGGIAQTGAALVNLAVLLYVINLAWSVGQSKTENVHAIFVLTASCWLLVTTFWGMLLLFNFTMDLFPEDSMYYLSSHAHAGIVGWFLLLVLGVGSRLLPMFLISKYTNEVLLWIIYGLINGGLILFIIFELNPHLPDFRVLSMSLIALGLWCFCYYAVKAYHGRIRKKIDQQMKLSLFAIGMTLIPLLVLAVLFNSMKTHPGTVMAYGFCIFFGWITSIILGMTFKTLPFMVWNKIYQFRSGKRKTPDPKDLFSHIIFSAMVMAYSVGFCVLLIALVSNVGFLLPWGSGLMVLSAILYIVNVFQIISHKTKKHESALPS